MKILTIVLIITTIVKAQIWQDLNIGNTLDLEFHPDSTNVMFFTIALGGLYTSDDYGESIDTILSDVVAYDLTFNVSSPDTMYLACAALNNQRSGVLKLIHTNGTYDSIWCNNGIDLSDEAIVRFIRIVPESPEIMFVSTSTQLGGNLYRSTDYGRNWSALELPVEGRVNFIEIDPNSGGAVYCGSAANVLFRSLDHGNSWISLDYGATTDWYPTNLDIHVNDNSALYLASQAEGLFKSSDTGSSWTLLNSLPNSSCTNVEIDPNNTSSMFIISHYGIYRTIDSGANWIDYTFNLTGIGSPVRNLFIDPSSQYVFVTPDFFTTYRLDLTTVSIVGNQETLPNLFSLNCYPNPTNGRVSILVNSALKADIRIDIWDIEGRLVKTYGHSQKASGSYSLSWDGLDMNGKMCSSGVYLVTTTNHNSRIAHKITILN